MRGLLPPHPLFLLPLLCAAVLAAPGASLVDGTDLEGAALIDGDAETVRFDVGGQVRAVPAARLVAIEMPPGEPAPAEDGFNLYLRNGDRLRGKVSGIGSVLTLESSRVEGFTAPLDAVRGVRFGRVVAVHLRGR